MNQTDSQNEKAPVLPLAMPPAPVEMFNVLGVRGLAIPPGWDLKRFDHEQDQPTPSRKKGKFILHDGRTFIQFVNLHKLLSSDGSGATQIYADVKRDGHAFKSLTLTAVLNDHDYNEFGQHWRDLRAVFSPRNSPELDAWTGKSGAWLSQEDFALFLEDHADDITGDWDGKAKAALSDEDIISGAAPQAVDPANRWPSAAAMEGFARNLLITRDFRVQSAYDPQTGGVRLSFTDDETQETKATLAAFSRFRISIPVFEGVDSPYYLFTARLRVKPAGAGKVGFRFELIRPDRVIDQAVAVLVETIKQETGMEGRFFMGEPG